MLSVLGCRRVRAYPGLGVGDNIRSRAVDDRFQFNLLLGDLDLVPKGRDEDNLPFTMAWLRHHDRYETGYLADPDRPYSIHCGGSA